MESSTTHDLYAKYDIVVVGGGPVGLATALECAKTGQKVLVLEQSVFYNQSGSSGDLVRMYRTAYTEDFMATLAYKSMAIWDELEKEAGEPLRMMSGLLNFGDPNYGAGGPEGTLNGPIPNLEKYDMKYTKLTRSQIEADFPFQNLPDYYEGLDMPDNGCINVSLLLRTLHKLCEQRGVQLMDYATVRQILRDESSTSPSAKWIVGGEMSGPRGQSIRPTPFGFRTDKIALTMGAYTNHVLHPSFGFSLDLSIWEMVYAYWTIDSDIRFPKMWFQFAEDSLSADGSNTPVSNLFYGFPALPWGPPNLCRISLDAATNVISDPVQRQYTAISEADLTHVRQWVGTHVLGAGPHPVPAFAGTCLQTNVVDNMFVLDFVPGRYLPDGEADKSIVVFTAGWAMKFVPLLGRALKELLVDGKSQFDMSQFKMDRKGIIKDGPPVTNVMEATAHHHSGSSVRRMGH